MALHHANTTRATSDPKRNARARGDRVGRPLVSRIPVPATKTFALARRTSRHGPQQRRGHLQPLALLEHDEPRRWRRANRRSVEAINKHLRLLRTNSMEKKQFKAAGLARFGSGWAGWSKEGPASRSSRPEPGHAVSDGSASLSASTSTSGSTPTTCKYQEPKVPDSSTPSARRHLDTSTSCRAQPKRQAGRSAPPAARLRLVFRG